MKRTIVRDWVPFTGAETYTAGELVRVPWNANGDRADQWLARRLLQFGTGNPDELVLEFPGTVPLTTVERDRLIDRVAEVLIELGANAHDDLAETLANEIAGMAREA